MLKIKHPDFFNKQESTQTASNVDKIDSAFDLLLSKTSHIEKKTFAKVFKQTYEEIKK